jgi:hypothetical protein
MRPAGPAAQLRQSVLPVKEQEEGMEGDAVALHKVGSIYSEECTGHSAYCAVQCSAVQCSVTLPVSVVNSVHLVKGQTLQLEQRIFRQQVCANLRYTN